MAIRCPKCASVCDVARFEADKTLRCPCGYSLDLSLIETLEDFLRFAESDEERKKARDIQDEAQIICRMILDDAYSEIDIEIAKEKLEAKVERFFPDRMDLYRMIYDSRFKRLWDQFRAS